MFLMFAVFELGILGVFIFVIPFIVIYRLFGGEDRYMMQRVNRFLFGIWLGLLDAGGLFRANRVKGSLVDGPCVVIANHPGLFDVLVMIRDIPGLSVLAKQSLTALPGLAKIFDQAGFVFVSQDDDLSASVDITNKIVGLLKNGRKFMLFPEGTRSPKGGLHHFRAGAFKIARVAGVPVLPVLIKNHPPFMPKEDKWFLPQSDKSVFDAEFMEPIPPPETGKELQAAKNIERLFRERLMLEQEAL
jgi:1-acyl-sn-glycerol-3-phosphate acyltransferase